MESEEKTLIYWCNNCKIPIIKESDKIFHKCPICNNWIKYLSKDIRPVFPEERLLLELITDNEPYRFANNTVWCNNQTYYIDGIPYKLDSDIWDKSDPDKIKMQIDKYKENNSYTYFNKYIDSFLKSNKTYYNYLKQEAMDFICNVANRYPDMHKYVSFSGGKDSTVTSDLVIKALANPSILHIFCDTTLEYPFTTEYVKRLKEEHPQMLIRIIRNKEHNFYNLCDDIGVPTRSKRWCCTIFKTGVISKEISALFGSSRIMYFNGLRRYESKTRSNYLRVNLNSEHQKIQNQISVSPIIDWKTIDIWLYILNENIDFNFAYRLGFNRAGCLYCPNSSKRNEFLSNIYMHDIAKRWHNYLLDFATKTGVEDPKRYIDSRLWKVKYGGSGLASSDELNIIQKNCIIDENAKTYTIDKPINEEFYTLFIPFGKVCRELGRKIINETLVLRNGVPIISIQIQSSNKIKIKTMNIKDHEFLHRKIYYQLLKFKLCRRCYKCEAACPQKAIKVQNNSYKIDEKLCTHCLSCTDTNYVAEGCLMKQYLRKKDNKYDK